MKGGWIMADLALCAREDKMGLAVSAAGGVLVLFWHLLDNRNFEIGSPFAVLAVLALLFMGMALLHVMLAGLVLKLRSASAGEAPSPEVLVACSRAVRLFRAEAVAGTLELFLLLLAYWPLEVAEAIYWPDHDTRKLIASCVDGFVVFLLLAFFLGIAKCLIEAHRMCGACFSGKA